MVKIKVLFPVENPVIYTAVHDDIRHQRLLCPIIRDAVLHGLRPLAVKGLPRIMAVKCEAYVISDVLISRFKKPLRGPELTGPVPAQMRRDNSRAIHDRFCITFRGMQMRGTLRSPISQLLPIPIFLDQNGCSSGYVSATNGFAIQNGLSAQL